MQITNRELQDYFISNGKFIENGSQVIVVMKENGRFDIQLTLENDEKDRSSFEVYDEVCDAGELITSYKIKTLDDLKKINATTIWSRFFYGNAEVVFTDFDGDNIGFRKPSV